MVRECYSFAGISLKKKSSLRPYVRHLTTSTSLQWFVLSVTLSVVIALTSMCDIASLLGDNRARAMATSILQRVTLKRSQELSGCTHRFRRCLFFFQRFGYRAHKFMRLILSLLTLHFFNIIRFRRGGHTHRVTSLPKRRIETSRFYDSMPSHAHQFTTPLDRQAQPPSDA